MFLQKAGWCFRASTMSLCSSVLTALPSVVLRDPLTDKQCPLHPYTSLSRSGTAATLVPFPHWPHAYACDALTHSSSTSSHSTCPQEIQGKLQCRRLKQCTNVKITLCVIVLSHLLGLFAWFIRLMGWTAVLNCFRLFAQYTPLINI